jgi:hypothetical protein
MGGSLVACDTAEEEIRIITLEDVVFTIFSGVIFYTESYTNV